MAMMEFAWENPGQYQLKQPYRPAGIRLSDEVLFKNALWFIKMRWTVIIFFACFQLSVIFFKDFFRQIGVVFDGYWPAVTALVLAAVNIWYTITIREHGDHGFTLPAVNIWTQIIVDLLCLTVVVHYLGSVGTPSPFLYVLHIVLAGVFLSTEASIVVVFLAGLCYNGCVVLEYGKIFHPHNIFMSTLPNMPDAYHFWGILFQVVSINIFFLLVWYMVAQLSTIIRTRENQLIEAEAQTRKLQKEKDRYAVQMTHQLKSPLDAIRSSISLAAGGYCGSVPEEIMQVLKKIDFRAKGMSQLIIDVLKLARVNAFEDAPEKTMVNVSAVLRETIDELRPLAEKRKIEIKSELVEMEWNCIKEQSQVLFENILANAITYSYDNGKVRVTSSIANGAARSVISVSDNGIGITAEKLPHIFDEYFRTKEACEHNAASSGIGLAIVKRVAQNHGLQFSVESELKKGTTFNIYAPV